MPEFEALRAVRDFVEQGGNVLLVIAFVTAVMWSLIYERFWYFQVRHRGERERIRELWRGRSEHSSWHAHQIRRMLISQVRQKLQQRLGPIETIVKLCPMLGLLGTVTGMIEVFDVMAAGSGNARGMAGGVSKATLPTMAGMVAALSGMLFSIQLRRFARDEGERMADSLEIGHS
ncbi:MAG: MotA/TolQ/ExbB proton channel family protein [Myxococcota bacterium]